MSIVQALVQARSKMSSLVPDTVATIPTRAGGQYKFKYVSLALLIETVTPPLLEHGVLLVQDVGSDPSMPQVIHVVTKLLGDGETVSSEPFCLLTDGTPRDMAAKVTSARRIQLMSMLGLSASDEEESPVVRHAGPQPQRAESTLSREQLVGIARKWEANPQPALFELVQQLRELDKSTDSPMPTVAQDGKTTSMYHYLVSLANRIAGDGMGTAVLSYLLGRVVTQQTPPSIALRTFVTDLRDGKYHEELKEAAKVARS